VLLTLCSKFVLLFSINKWKRQETQHIHTERYISTESSSQLEEHCIWLSATTAWGGVTDCRMIRSILIK